jgi:putative ABC transport system substrate-binding protein
VLPAVGRSRYGRSRRAQSKSACFGLEPTPLFRLVWNRFGKDFGGQVTSRVRTSRSSFATPRQGDNWPTAQPIWYARRWMSFATFGDLATKLAQKATDGIPIVALGDDLLGSGLIGSLSRPAGNTTGISILAAELSAKRLELLQMMVPGLSRVAGLWDPSTGPSQVGMSENAARAMKLKLQILEVGRREDLDAAFRAARDGQLQALSVFSSPVLASLHREIIDRAAEYRLPAIYQWREHAEARGLMSYGPSLPAMWEQDGALVAKVLKGAKPSEMPVEQPSKFELVINLKTARALGLTVSNQMQLLADEVIE